MKLDIKKELKILETKLYPWISSLIFSTNHKDIKNFYLVFVVLSGLLLILGIFDPSISHCEYNPCYVHHYNVHHYSAENFSAIPDKVRLVGESMIQNISPGQQPKKLYVVTDDNCIWEVVVYSKEWLENYFIDKFGDKSSEQLANCYNRYEVTKRDMPPEIVKQCQDKVKYFGMSIYGTP